jgi:hypothetical protein
VAESPTIREARERLISTVPSAVETLADLLDSQADGVRLGAAREILDRGGLPARQDHHVEVEIGLDDEIEALLRGVARQQEGAELEAEMEIEDAIVIEDEREEDLAALPVGEQAARGRADAAPLVVGWDHVGGPDAARDVADELELNGREVPEDDAAAWWQANPQASPPV